MVEQQAMQLVDLSQQRDALVAKTTTLDQAALALRDRLQAQEAAAAAGRESLADHVRAVENRAHAEVDRAREETKALRHEHAAAVREHAAARQAWRHEVGVAHAAATEARREAAREQARASAMEQQLSKLADLPATLEATFSLARLSRAHTPRARPKPKVTRAKTKSDGRKSTKNDAN